MTNQQIDHPTVVDELKEFGRQLTVTIKAIAGSEQVRSLGHELKEGLRDAAQNVEETWENVRARDEVQRLQARAADVTESFKTGDAQQEIRQELGEALHALNIRLAQILERIQPVTAPPADTPPVETTGAVQEDGYTGATRKFEG